MSLIWEVKNICLEVESNGTEVKWSYGVIHAQKGSSGESLQCYIQRK